MVKLSKIAASALAGGLIFVPETAFADCTVPHVLTNGQVADATQVMANFNAVAGCLDTAVTVTGTPQTGAIAVFSGSEALSGGNLTGDVTTSGGTATSLSNTGVTAGTYTNATIMVDSKGRISAASSGTAGEGGGGASSPLKHSMLASYSSLANANEQIASAYIAPFGSLKDGAVIKLRMSGILASTTRQRTLRIKWGGSMLVGYQTTSSTNTTFKIELTITRRSATTAAGFYQVDFGNASNNASNSVYLNSILYSGTAPNMDADLTFEATVQGVTGAVANEMIVREFNVEIMNVG